MSKITFGFTGQDLLLLSNLFKMNVRDRHLGSMLGLGWAVLQPLMVLAVFVFIFGFIFKAKLPGAETTFAYAIWMISGYGPWLAVNESLLSGTNSVVSGASLVKNIPFKTELLPIASGLMGLVPLTVSLVFLVILLLIDGRPPTWHIVYLIPTIILQFTFIIGFAYFLSAINVFVRDVSQALPNILLIVMFLSPIFYSITAFPGVLQKISQYNPFYIIAEGYRQPLVFNGPPDMGGLAFLAILSGLMFIFGLKFFRRLSPYFDSAL